MCASVVVAADVAVGCPFGGEERGGRVLIFNGNRDVATKGLTLSQELRAAWTPRGSTPGYGFTLRGGQDLDNNQYPGKYSLGTSRSSTIRFPRCNQNSFSDLHSFSSPLFLPVPLSRAQHSWPPRFPHCTIPVFAYIAFLFFSFLLKPSVRCTGVRGWVPVNRCRIHSSGIFSARVREGEHEVEKRKRRIIIHYPHVQSARHSSLCSNPKKLWVDKATFNRITLKQLIIFCTTYLLYKANPFSDLTNCIRNLTPIMQEFLGGFFCCWNEIHPRQRRSLKPLFYGLIFSLI